MREDDPRDGRPVGGADPPAAGDAQGSPADFHPEEAPLSRRAYLYEVPAFFVILVAAQRAFFPEDPGWRETNPSPLWIGILLFGLRYGIGAGILSGIASAAVHAAGAAAAGEFFRFEDADFYARPGLFVVGGAAVGAAVQRLRHRIAELQNRITDLRDRINGLLDRIASQQKALRAVEQQVVSQMSSIVTLYHGSQQLGALDRETLMGGMLDFFTAALHATKTSLFVKKEGAWELSDRRGWSEADAYPRRVVAGQGIIGRAAQEKRVVSLRDLFQDEDGALQEEGGGADAIMAAPLLGATGDAEFVFAVQRMPLLRFNSASLNLLTLLADWGQQALARVSRFDQLRSQSMVDDEFGVGSASYFDRRSRQEFARSRRHALPFSIVLVSPEGLSALAPEPRRNLLLALATLLQQRVRSIDIVTCTKIPEAPFALLLMTATRAQAQTVAQRVREGHERLGLPGRLRLGVGSFTTEMHAVEDLIHEARRRLA